MKDAKTLKVVLFSVIGSVVTVFVILILIGVVNHKKTNNTNSGSSANSKTSTQSSSGDGYSAIPGNQSPNGYNYVSTQDGFSVTFPGSPGIHSNTDSSGNVDRTYFWLNNANTAAYSLPYYQTTLIRLQIRLAYSQTLTLHLICMSIHLTVLSL